MNDNTELPNPDENQPEAQAQGPEASFPAAHPPAEERAWTPPPVDPANAWAPGSNEAAGGPGAAPAYPYPGAGGAEGQVPPGTFAPGAVPPGAVPPGAVPPGAVPPGYGGYGYYGQPQWGPQRPAGRIRRRRARPVIAAALVVGTVAASAAITHEVWPSSARTTIASQSPSSSGGSGNSGDPGYFDYPGSGSSNSGSATDPSSSESEGSGGPSDVSSIASKVDPDLVLIDTTFSYQEADGAGTGIVLTSNGEILTNNHVIDGATSIKVTDVGNGKTYSANVVGYDPSQDVAVLQLVGASGLKTASISSAAAKSGESVVAIGNAGGTSTLTPAGGSITALNQSITASDELDGTQESLVGLLETNADVQAGDSGGPLVNASGQVVGMDTAASEGYSLSGYSEGGQGYAIPISEATSIAKQIEAGDSSSTIHVGSTAFLGVLISSSDMSGSSFQGYGGFGSSGGDSGTVSGAEVAGVVQGGAAADAGLAEGDVITALNGASIGSGTDLSKAVLKLKPGQTVTVTYTDTSGASHTVSMTLQSGPPA